MTDTNALIAQMSDYLLTKSVFWKSSVRTWLDHPSYNTKGRLLADYREVQGARIAFDHLLLRNGLTTFTFYGVDWAHLRDVAAFVKDYKRTPECRQAWLPLSRVMVAKDSEA